MKNNGISKEEWLYEIEISETIWRKKNFWKTEANIDSNEKWTDR